MGIGAGTGVGGSAQPPQIREMETTAFVENMKKVILGLLPSDTVEVTPWTQREYDEVFKYRSEAGRPMLHPLMFLRASVGAEIIEEGIWQPIYDTLLDYFPPEIKERLAWEMNQPFPERDADYVVLNQLLTATAKGIGWLYVVTRPIEPNSPAATYLMLNIALPYIAMRGAIYQADAVLYAATQWINTVGPNYPNYDSIVSYLSEVGKALAEFNELREEIEKGNDTPEIRQRLTESADHIELLNALYERNGLGEELNILKATVGALAVISAAWALNQGTPSLLIGSSLALIGIESGESSLGLIGNSFDSMLDTLFLGVLGAFVFGPQAEIDELTALYLGLIAFSQSP